jgi:sulfide:quinone oxidoreductase
MNPTYDKNNPMQVVIAGGGVAALEATMALRDLAGERVEITMICPQDEFVFQPVSVGEPFALGKTRRISLRKFSADFDIHLEPDGLAWVAPSSHAAFLTGGGEVRYDVLLVAVGARRVPVFEHAITFRGQEDTESVHGLIQDLEGGYSKRIAFLVPPGISWSLPIYELALMTARRAHDMSLEGVELTIVTPEEAPLAVFGPHASGELQRLLESAGISVHSASLAQVPTQGRVVVQPGDREIECDRVVALPAIQGPAIRGLPNDPEGFLRIDAQASVVGVEHVFAAGDGTNFPVKQGGIACQQADAAAEAIARLAGVRGEPRSIRPILRGDLITGAKEHFLRTPLTGKGKDDAQVGTEVLWWPPTKIAGRYLAPYLVGAEESARLVDLDRETEAASSGT